MPDLDLILRANVSSATAGLQKVEQGLAKTAIAAQKVDSSLLRSVKSTNEAAFALGNLGRVAQDAPFGFIGIANNLNPLLESFQRLKATSGSTGTALKAMAAALTGPAGIGIAVSVVSSLLLVFGDRLFGQKKQTDLAKIAVNEYAQAMQKAFEAAGKQIAQVSQIVAALEAENTTLAQRKKLIEDLNGINSTYFNGLKIEHGRVVGLADAYQRYADNIFKVAKAKAAQEQIQKLATSLVSTTDQINQLTNQLTGTGRALSLSDAAGGIGNIKKDFEELNRIINADVISLQDFALVSRLTGLSEQKVNELLSKRRGLRTEELRTLAQIADLSKLVAANDLGAIVGNVKPEKIKELKEEIQRQLFPQGILTDVFPVKISPTVDIDLDKTKGSLQDSIDRFLAEIRRLSQARADVIGDMGFKLPENFFKISKEDQEKLVENFKQINEITKSAVADLFVGIGENLGNFKNPLAGIFEILGSALTKLGVYVILSSKLLASITAALNAATTGPGGVAKGIAVGIGLVALGTIIKNIPKLASGGIVPPGYPNDSFPAFLQSNEAVIPLDRINDFLRPSAASQPIVLTPILRGSDIYLQQQRYASSVRRGR